MGGVVYFGSGVTAGNPGGNHTSAMFVDPANGNLHLVPTRNVLVNNTGSPTVKFIFRADHVAAGLTC